MSWSLPLGDTGLRLTHMVSTGGAVANTIIQSWVACGSGPVGQQIEICPIWLNIVRKFESSILCTDTEETEQICGMIYLL